MNKDEIVEKLKSASVYKGVEHNDETYYGVGDLDNIVASNSFFSSINPDEGGSRKKAELFFTEKQEETSRRGIEKGKTLHKWIKNNRDFTVFEGKAPSEPVAGIMQAVFDSGVAAFAAQVDDEQLFKMEVIRATRAAAWHNDWGDEAVYKNILKEGEDYLKFLAENVGKVILKKDVMESLEGMQGSIHDSRYSELLLDRNPYVLKEIPLFFEFEGLPMKILIDNLEIEDNRLILTDLKSTAFGASSYMGTQRIGVRADGSVGRVYHDGSFHRFRTYRQLGLYAYGLQQITGLPVEAQIAAVESKAPYDFEMHPVTPVYLAYGVTEFKTCAQLTFEWMVERNKRRDDY